MSRKIIVGPTIMSSAEIIKINDPTNQKFISEIIVRPYIFGSIINYVRDFQNVDLRTDYETTDFYRMMDSIQNKSKGGNYVVKIGQRQGLDDPEGLSRYVELFESLPGDNGKRHMQSRGTFKDVPQDSIFSDLANGLTEFLLSTLPLAIQDLMDNERPSDFHKVRIDSNRVISFLRAISSLPASKDWRSMLETKLTKNGASQRLALITSLGSELRFSLSSAMMLEAVYQLAPLVDLLLSKIPDKRIPKLGLENGLPVIKASTEMDSKFKSGEVQVRIFPQRERVIYEEVIDFRPTKVTA